MNSQRVHDSDAGHLDEKHGSLSLEVEELRGHAVELSASPE